jgi:hypothetical protein
MDESLPSPSELLEDLYANPKFGLLSKSKFVQKVKQQYPSIKRKDIEDFISSKTLQQTFTRKTFKGYYKVVAKPRTFQSDIFFMDEYASNNKSYGSFLLMVDILSRKAFVHPMNNKNLESIIQGLKTLLQKIGKVNGIESDDEFNKQSVKDLLDSKDISFSSVVSKQDHISKGNALGIVDTTTRTLKKFIKKFMAQNNSPKFIDYLDDLVDAYNETPHSSLDNKTPDDVFADGELQKKIYKKAHKHNNELKGKIGLNIGDFVRRAIVKKKFEKEKETFSKGIFVVYDIEGTRYRLIDEDGDIDTSQLYKYHELLKADAEKTKTPSIVIILNKHFGKSKKGKRKAEKDMDEVEKATSEYRRVKKVVKRLKKEGIDVSEAVIKRKRDDDFNESIADRLAKRKIIKTKRSTRNT